MSALTSLKIPLAFPICDCCVVRLLFHAAHVQVVGVDVGSKRAFGEFASFPKVDRFVEGGWNSRQVARFVPIATKFVAWFELSLDTVQASG
jgi:hypothetical protein